MDLIGQIKEELKPHHVDGFRSMCYPLPNMNQIDRLIVEVQRLTQLCEEQGRKAAKLERGRNSVILAYKIEKARGERLEATLSQAREEVERLKVKNSEYKDMLEDVVNELDLSDGMIEQHGPLGTAPATLVGLILARKEQETAMLKAGMKPISAVAGLALNGSQVLLLTKSFTAKLEASEQREKVLRDALEKYGKCLPTCWSEKSFDGPCNCGFQAALAAASEVGDDESK